MIDISVVMPVYNESMDDLDKSISSILEQTYKNIELIIIYDNPENKLLKDYLIQKSSENKKINLLINYENLKLTASENKGIKLAKGKYVARIDADDIAYNNRLENQLKFLTKNHLDFVFSDFSIINENNDITRKKTFSKHNIIDQKRLRHILSLSNIAIGPTFFFKKDIIQRVGLYRKFNGEDYDLVTRCLVNNLKIGFQSDPTIFKKLRKNSMTYMGSIDQYIAERSISKFYRKNNFYNVMPISFLKDNINNIHPKQIKHYKKYISMRYMYNDHKNLFNFYKVIFSIFKSKIVIQRSLWSVINKILNKL